MPANIVSQFEADKARSDPVIIIIRNIMWGDLRVGIL